MRVMLSVALTLMLGLAISCSATMPESLPEAEEARLKEELNDRSFRQFEPSGDADPRKGVILEFFDGITLWAQYAAGEYAVWEWEISAQDFLILSRGDAGYELIFVKPRSRQKIPMECENCIDVLEVSVSVRNVEEGMISFKLNDPEGNLPLPFPVFDGWTRFEEDEYFE